MILYVDMDDVLCAFSKTKNMALEIDPNQEYPHSVRGFYENLEPLEGAIDALNALRNRAEYEVYILTAPSVFNPLSYTEKRNWVEKHIGFEMLNRLIISPDKSLLRGDILIDDRLNGHGQDKFEGRHIHFGSDEFPHWDAVLMELEN